MGNVFTQSYTLNVRFPGKETVLFACLLESLAPEVGVHPLQLYAFEAFAAKLY